MILWIKTKITHLHAVIDPLILPGPVQARISAAKNRGSAARTQICERGPQDIAVGRVNQKFCDIQLGVGKAQFGRQTICVEVLPSRTCVHAFKYAAGKVSGHNRIARVEIIVERIRA